MNNLPRGTMNQWLTVPHDLLSTLIGIPFTYRLIGLSFTYWPIGLPFTYRPISLPFTYSF